MHKIKCFKELPFHDMIVGAVYNYVVHESVVEYCEDFPFSLKQYMPIYAWAQGLVDKAIVPLNDIEED